MTGNCALCGTRRRTLHRDHIHPRWKAKRDGWTESAIEDPSNIQFICEDCHHDKTREDGRPPQTEKQFTAFAKTWMAPRTQKQLGHLAKIRDKGLAKAHMAPRTQKQLAHIAKLSSTPKTEQQLAQLAQARAKAAATPRTDRQRAHIASLNAARLHRGVASGNHAGTKALGGK